MLRRYGVMSRSRPRPAGADLRGRDLRRAVAARPHGEGNRRPPAWLARRRRARAPRGRRGAAAADLRPQSDRAAPAPARNALVLTGGRRGYDGRLMDLRTNAEQDELLALREELARLRAGAAQLPRPGRPRAGPPRLPDRQARRGTSRLHRRLRIDPELAGDETAADFQAAADRAAALNRMARAKRSITRRVRRMYAGLRRALIARLPRPAVSTLKRARDLPAWFAQARRSGAAAQLEAARHEAEGLSTRPLISLVMPTYKTEQRYLREAVDSVHRPALPRVGAGRRRRRLRGRGAARGRSRPTPPPSPAIRFEPSGGKRRHLGRQQRRPGALPRRVRRLPRPRRRAHPRRAAARRPGACRRPRARRRLLRLRQAQRPRRPRRPLPEARLVAGLRAGGDVHRPSAGAAALAGRGGRRLRLRPSTRSRTSSSCCGSASEPTASTTSRRSSTTGGRSPAASPPAPKRSHGVPSCRRGRSAPTSSAAASTRRAIPHPTIPHRAVLASAQRLGPDGAGQRRDRRRRGAAPPLGACSARCSSGPRRPPARDDRRRRARAPASRPRRAPWSAGDAGAFSRAARNNPGAARGDGELPRLPRRGRRDRRAATGSSGSSSTPGSPASAPPARCSPAPTAASTQAGRRDRPRRDPPVRCCAGFRRRRRRLLRLAPLRPRGLGAERASACWSRAGDFEAAGGFDELYVASTRTSTSASGWRGAACQSVYAPRPRVAQPPHAGRARGR